MKFWINCFCLISLTSLVVSCVKTSYSEFKERLPISGISQKNVWQSSSEFTPIIRVFFEEVDGLFYRISHINIYDEKVSLNEEYLGLKQMNLIFVEKAIDNPTWSKSSNKEEFCFSGGDGAEAFTIKLIFSDKQLLETHVYSMALDTPLKLRRKGKGVGKDNKTMQNPSHTPRCNIGVQISASKLAV